MPVSPKLVRPRRRKTTPFNPKIIVGVCAAILLVLGLLLVAQGFVDTHDYQQRIRQAIKEKTGKEVIIKGRVTVSLVPVPTVFIPNIELREPGGRSPAPSMTIEEVDVRASVISVLFGHPRISAITLVNPALEVERGENGIVNWDWLNTTLLRNVSGGNSAINWEVEGGKILYHNAESNKDLLIQNVYVNGRTGAHPDFSGSVDAYGRRLYFSAISAAGASLPAGSIPLNIKLYSDKKNTVQLQGGVDISGETPKITGKLSVDMDNALFWVTKKVDDTPQIFGMITHQVLASKEEEVKLPLKFTGDLNQEGWKAAIEHADFAGLDSTGNGKLELLWDDKLPLINIAMHFVKLDVDDMRYVVEKIVEERNNSTNTNMYDNATATQENLLPKELQVAVDVAADHLVVGKQVWESAEVTAKLADQVITVDNFSIHLPGESSLSLLGTVSQAATSTELRFEGSMETEGKSLRQLLTVFDESAVELPETGFRNFHARSNIFISSEQVRLSEAEVKLDELNLNGGMVAYLDANPRLEADVRLKNIDLDYFRDVWRATQQHTGKEKFFLEFNKTTNFDWLRNLQTSIDFRINIDQFTFLDRKGDNATFRIFARAGEFGLYDIKMTYPTETVEGNFAFDVKGEQPMVNVLFNTGELNASYFSPTAVASAPVASEPAKDGTVLSITPQAEMIEKPADKVGSAVATTDTGRHWPEELIDMGWMDGFNGEFDISIGSLAIGGTKVDNIKFKGKLDHNVLSFKDLTFLYWQGKCSVNGSLYGGRVPGLSMGYTIYNAELYEIIKSLTGRTNLSGRVSASGTIATSGVNLKSWIEQTDATIVLAGRGVRVDGLNLQGVVDAVGVARTAADVFTNVNLALTNGNTLFSVDGAINMKNGVLKTPGIALKSGPTLGNLRGEVDVLPWTISLSTQFQFPSLSTETIPTMPVQLSGTMDNPQIRTDTASLEAYKAATIVGGK